MKQLNPNEVIYRLQQVIATKASEIKDLTRDLTDATENLQFSESDNSDLSKRIKDLKEEKDFWKEQYEQADKREKDRVLETFKLVDERLNGLDEKWKDQLDQKVRPLTLDAMTKEQLEEIAFNPKTSEETAKAALAQLSKLNNQ